ncbi:uncharacterized protein LOC101864107 [Aplysia californica]|uniref:Uncharacterized protein LOC101864107 n=1 Tax=Aplysia californica TaxID=6500 RepID=A0ABM0JAC2_APLCA|nr:uncharacterized protein LOC101864107 [Aplysia californica]
MTCASYLRTIPALVVAVLCLGSALSSPYRDEDLRPLIASSALDSDTGVFLDMRTRRGSGQQLYYSPHSFTSKRMNQISCSCCSNSFNSNCCFQCMQRLGKRSGARSDNKNEAPELLRNGPELYYNEGGRSSDHDLLSMPLQPEVSDWRAKGRACSCCLYQMHQEPFAQSWPCCRLCKRSKRSVGAVPAPAETSKKET